MVSAHDLHTKRQSVRKSHRQHEDGMTRDRARDDGQRKVSSANVVAKERAFRERLAYVRRKTWLTGDRGATTTEESEDEREGKKTNERTFGGKRELQRPLESLNPIAMTPDSLHRRRSPHFLRRSWPHRRGAARL